jgi:hypothetical protein
MNVTCWTVIIFVLSKWPPNGLCLSFNVGNKGFICRAVSKPHDPWIGTNVVKKTSDLKCWIIAMIGQARGKRCVLLTILNTTRNYVYVHLTSRNCDIPHVKYSGSEIHCIFPNEERHPLNGASTKFRKISTKHPVYFINSSGLIRNAIFMGSRKSNGFNAEALGWRTKLGTRYSNVFICSERDGSIGREERDESSRRKDRVFGKILVRKRRNILENSTTAFSTYYRNTVIASDPITPPLTKTVQNPITLPRRATEVWNSCPQSVVVNCSTIFITPTVVGTRHAGSLVATGKLTPLKHFSATPLLRNNTLVAQTSHLGSAPTLALNATSTGIIAHPEERPQNATYIYDENLVAVICTTQGSAFITTLGCATVTSVTTTSSTAKPTLRTTTESDKSDNTKQTKLYVGLIAGGGVLLFIIICIALFLFVRRYRRIKALRRKAKQISYFNRFDCSSAWDEPDRFGGSKLSVFTLKNSKFDIDWESTHDSKQ